MSTAEAARIAAAPSAINEPTVLLEGRYLAWLNPRPNDKAIARGPVVEHLRCEQKRAQRSPTMARHWRRFRRSKAYDWLLRVTAAKSGAGRRGGMLHERLTELLLGQADASLTDDVRLRDWLYCFAPPEILRHFLLSHREALTPWSGNEQEAVDLLGQQLPLEYLSPGAQVFRRADGPRTLVCFAGNAQRLNVPVQQFHLLAHPYFDRIIYLRDPDRQSFMHGIVGVADSFAALMEWTAVQAGEQAGISVISTSGGGWAAIQFAEFIQAKRVALFSPSFTFKEMPALDGDAALDPADVRLYFAADANFDRRLRAGWKETGYDPCVRVLSHDSHGTLSFVFDNQHFDPLMAWLNQDFDGVEPLSFSANP